MEKEKLVEYVKFLDKYKSCFGFHKYKILLADKTHKNPRHIAEAKADHYKNELKVIIYKKFIKRPDKEEILIHELIHGRLGLLEDRLEALITEIKYEMEEEMVNEISNGFMSFISNNEKLIKKKNNK